MRKLINILDEAIKKNKIICPKCGWSWNKSEGGSDSNVCHKCGYENLPKTSNFDKVIDSLIKKSNSEKIFSKQEHIKKFVKSYVEKNKIVIKFVNSCSTGMFGVRTKDMIIICSPGDMQSLGDFIYTIFHEIRHEKQISEIKMSNPLTEFDLEDFENLYKQYWEMELDADQFAKNKVVELISKSVELSIRGIVNKIKEMKKDGIKYEDIIDHPLVKNLLDRLEEFI